MNNLMSLLLIITIVLLLLALLYYIFLGINLTKIGKLKNEKALWRVWIPIFNIYMLGKLTVNKLTGWILILLSLLISTTSINKGNININTNLSKYIPSYISNILSIIYIIISLILFIYSFILPKKLKKSIPNEETIKVEDNTEKIEVIEELSFDNNEDIEVVDLSTPLDNPLERRKENRIVFLIITFLIIFALSLPTITKLLQPDTNNTPVTEEKDIKYYSTTEDGLLEINKEEGYIIAKKIRFYNFTKRSNNTVSLVYLPETLIKNVNDLNIYIELYNSSKTVIYREQFTSDNILERKINGTYKLNLNENIYKESTYAKIVLLDSTDFNSLIDTLICTKTTITDLGTLTTKVTYNFSNNGLYNYEVTKQSDSSSYSDTFTRETESLSNLGIEDISSSSTSIYYKINLLNIDTSEYTPLYNLASTKKSIKYNEEDNKWSCK